MFPKFSNLKAHCHVLMWMVHDMRVPLVGGIRFSPGAFGGSHQSKTQMIALSLREDANYSDFQFEELSF
jgi:hypothetical protein